MKPLCEMTRKGMRTWLNPTVLFALFALGASLASPAARGADTATVHVYAAASLQPALEETIARYIRAGGGRVVGVYAASGSLARQIEHGAPADIFVSANTEWMDYLQAHGALRPNTRRTVLTNQLVIVHSPCTEKLEAGSIAQILRARPQARIAMGNPESVPAGSYAQQALTHLGLWAALKPHAVFAENARAALVWVARCEADMGVVYRTDALAGQSLGIGITAALPAQSHDLIAYPMAIIAGRNQPEVTRFAHYLAGDNAFAVFESFGFGRGSER